MAEYAKALFEYTAEKEGQISFQQGDIIKIDEWYV